MKAAKYYACCGIRIPDDVTGPDANWRMCRYCCIDRTLIMRGSSPLFRRNHRRTTVHQQRLEVGTR